MANGRVIVALFSACSLVAGMGLGHWLLEGRPAELHAAAPVAAAESPRLEPLLREIEECLRALTRALESRELSAVSPPATTREPAQLSGAQDAPELASALRELAAALGEVRAPGASPRATAADLATPAWIDREGAFAATGLRQAALTDDEDTLDRAIRAFRARFLFRTAQEVLSTFGAPDEIELESDSRWWNYELESEVGREELRFGFDAGTVYDVGYDLSRRQ